MSTRPARRPSPGADLAAHLRALGDEHLAGLLTIRPDLATPAPSSIAAMATRATSRASITRALGNLDRPTLTVAEALAITATSAAPSSAEQVSRAVGFPADDAVQVLLDRALAIGAPGAVWLVQAVREALAAQPLGLGPPLRALGISAADGWPVTTPAVRAALEQAPPAARRVLDALTWGPPAGSFEQIPESVQWLLDARILHRTSPTQVVLPREVALALREGVLSRGVALDPPLPEAPVRDPATVAAESTQAAETILRQLDLLVDTWAQDPPAVLRTGGVGVRDLRGLTGVVQGDAERVALVAELAGMLDLVGHHLGSHGSSWAPTSAALDRDPAPLPHRWAVLVSTWLQSARTPWLVGTRTEKGALRSALAPDLHRSWAPPLRRRVLQALSRWETGSAPDADQVHAHLAWHTPRSAPPVATVQAILTEADALGLTGAGALSTPARVLLQAGDPVAVAEAFAADLPTTVGEVFIQGDLTGVVPGRPEPALAGLLERTAQVESRGSAMTVRFTPESIRRALDGGTEAEQILADLAGFSLTPLPQPLEYLVRDTARSHGRLRVGRADSFLRASDDGALTAVLGDRRLEDLGLQMLAPTVAVARVGPQELLEALAQTGHSVLAEGDQGQVLTLQRRQARAARGVAPPPVTTTAPDADTARALVAQMRTGEDRARAGAGDGHSDDPVYALEVLRQAADGGTEVDLVIAGSDGASRQHRVRPLSVGGGRARVLDVAKQAELTVAAHRIISVGGGES